MVGPILIGLTTSLFPIKVRGGKILAVGKLLKNYPNPLREPGGPMALSALDDKSVEPVASDVARVLGPSEELWYVLIARMEASYGPLTEAWGFSGAKYGWSLRLKQKKRTILYLIPQSDTSLVGIVLGDRSEDVMRRSPGPSTLLRRHLRGRIRTYCPSPGTQGREPCFL